MMKFVGYLLALCIGLSLGLIGGGGSVLAVPILIYVMELTPKTAIATSLAVVGMVSVIGVIPHWRQGNVNFRTAAFFAPTAMIGAYLGARIADLPLITETFQLICFGLVMVTASILMIRKKGKSSETQAEVASKQYNLASHWLAIPLQGLGIGIITGFVGVGGGFIIVPALVLFGGIAMKEAIGTSLLIIAFNSATGFWGYLSQVELDWNLVISFTVAASLGTLVGAYLTRFIDAKNLQKGFGYFVLAVAVFVLIKR
ncbi:sulfite exporter TauE/SafE family protein [Waterburya agarophytonicola K14]|uniref:Probable membrane transporter protein n=1 Tax=Waterburya agarophytonicola KI4 TaxID=2874699 RepID=A0A964BTZ0_9CYAN|nr:sulfite exporter TauE/SafE family protein [Waterburya agarophytonicola]MCC0178127.1 sulfite exporter TauE/SafE family protein [Waterburya agarophytonicola KI4]